MRSGGEGEKYVQREITRLVSLSCEAPTLPEVSDEPSERPDFLGGLLFIPLVSARPFLGPTEDLKPMF